MAVLAIFVIVAGVTAFAFAIYAMARRIDSNARRRSPRKPGNPP
jgi:hypothetical protein